MTWFNNPQLQNCRRICVNNYRCEMYIGAYEHEKAHPQPVCLNVHAFVDSQKEGDCLDNAFNYDIIVDILRQACSGQHIDLQETLIDNVAQALFQYPAVKAVLVKSEKTAAYQDVDSVSVETFKLKNETY